MDFDFEEIKAGNTSKKLNWCVGKTIRKTALENNDRILFYFDDFLLIMHHRQDCCEAVEIEEIFGDFSDLVDTPLLVAEERVSTDIKPESATYGDEHATMEALKYDPNAPDMTADSYTWTFYTFRTIKGTVDIRWYGCSNGYYSESVDVDIIDPNDYGGEYPWYAES